MNTRPWRTTGPGDTSSAVTGIQFLLRAHGHAIATDGTYGASTQAAMTTFQNSAGLPADGIVGPETWAALVVATRLGSIGDAVGPYSSSGSLRRRGMTHSRSTAPSGRSPHLAWSPSRPRWGLSVDGVAGQETWSFLSTSSPGPRPWPLVRQGATQATNWRVLGAQHLLRGQTASDESRGVAGRRTCDWPTDLPRLSCVAVTARPQQTQPTQPTQQTSPASRPSQLSQPSRQTQRTQPSKPSKPTQPTQRTVKVLLSVAGPPPSAPPEGSSVDSVTV